MLGVFWVLYAVKLQWCERSKGLAFLLDTGSISLYNIAYFMSAAILSSH